MTVIRLLSYNYVAAPDNIPTDS